MVGCHADAIIYHQFVINPFLDFPTDHAGWELGSWGAGRDAARLRAAGGDGGGSVQRLVPGAEMLQAFWPRRAGSFAGDTRLAVSSKLLSSVPLPPSRSRFLPRG